MPTIRGLRAWEILDSRGRPTLEVECRLTGGVAAAQVPSGASTGRAEAVELRDGDQGRHRGLGCRQAVRSVLEEMAPALLDREFAGQRELDQALLKLDGTETKRRLGANSMLGVSLAFARAAAAEKEAPLYVELANLVGGPRPRLPRPTINLFSGGKHAGGQIPVQDLLLVPASAATIGDVLASVCDVYQAAAEIARRKYGMRLLTADEGGLAPPFSSVEQMFEDALEAIELTGRKPGVDVCLAVDVAASHFYEETGRAYHLGPQAINSEKMIEVLVGWSKAYPLVSVEDGLAEEDWEHWPALRERQAGRALTLGDDLLCTRPDRIRRAIAERACDALLLKVNQIGTLSEAAESRQLARAAGWHVTASARSGETEDHWLADLAVGWGCDQLKVGSITQSERLAKYNRLLRIEAETGWPVTAWPLGDWQP